MGIIQDVGPDVKNFKKGDRVVACFDLSCGQCAISCLLIYSGMKKRGPGTLDFSAVVLVHGNRKGRLEAVSCE